MSAYSQAPADIISLVFRKLPLRDKLLCESVCRSWLQLLRNQRTPQLSRTTWGDQLRIAICGPLDVRKKITLQQSGSGFPRIHLHPAQREFTSTESAFIRWSTRMSSVFATVDIDLHRMGGPAAENQTRSTVFGGGWMFPHLLAALYLARQSTASGPESHLDTGAESHHCSPPFVSMLQTRKQQLQCNHNITSHDITSLLFLQRGAAIHNMYA